MNLSTYLTPLQSPVVIDRSVNTEGDALEPPEGDDEYRDENAEHCPLRPLRPAFGREHEVVGQMSEHQNGKIERRELAEKSRSGLSLAKG